MTMYTDYFLRFPSEADATAVLFDGEMPRYTAIDVIGTIYLPTGEDEPAVALPGWHVNVRHTGDAPELDAYKVIPVSPVRMWA